MSFLIYLLKAEPLTTSQLRQVVQKHVFPVPHKMMVHPSLPAGHYFLYGCFTCTKFNFPDTLNYSVTQVSQSDFISEITTNATLQALIDRTVWSTDSLNNSKDKEYYYELVDLLLERRTYSGVKTYEQMAPTEWPDIARMDVERPMFLKSESEYDQPYGFQTNHTLVHKIDEHESLRDSHGRLTVPCGQVYFKLSPLDCDKAANMNEDDQWWTKMKEFPLIFEDTSFFGPEMDEICSDIIIGKCNYTDPYAYCKIPVRALELNGIYTLMLSGSLTAYDHFSFSCPYSKGMLYGSLSMICAFKTEFKVYLLIHIVSSLLKQRLNVIIHLMMFSTITDEEVYQLIKWVCFENKMSQQDVSNIRTILCVRPQLRMHTSRLFTCQELPKILEPFQSLYRPACGLTLAAIAGIIDNIQMFKLVYSHDIDVDKTYPSTLDNILMFTRYTRCVDYLLNNDPHYFERNLQSRPLWWFGHNVLVSNKEIRRFVPVLAKCRKLNGFNSSIPHYPSMDDICIYTGKLGLLAWMKTVSITWQDRIPHAPDLPNLCSPLEMVISGATPTTLKEYQEFYPSASHHICDMVLVKWINEHGLTNELLNMRFKDSSWPLFTSTKLPFVSILIKCTPTIIEALLNQPGLPPVDKLTINMPQWNAWFNQHINFITQPKTEQQQGSLLDVYMLAGRLDVIKYIISKYGVQMVTKQTESLIKLRPPIEQEEIKAMVADIKSMDSLLGPSSNKQKSKSKNKNKNKKKKKQSQSNEIKNDGPPHNQPSQLETKAEQLQIEQYERTVGKFKFSRKMIIGRGSHGTLVYKGVWCDKVPVAVKEMRKGFNTLIDKEVDTLMELTKSNDKDNLVKFLGMEETEDYTYLATSLCEMSLQELVEAHKDRFQSLNKQTLINDIINGVRFLHKNNIIHNDLNPRNILLKDDHLFITDMGLSKMSVETSFAFTHAPSGQGGYFPAEVINNQRKTNSVDIFALGCLMYYILADGGHPFGDNFHLRASKIHHNEFDIQQLTDQPCATDLITQMISHDPTTRPTINMVFNHPFFWDIKKRIMFITCVFQTIQDQPHSYLNKVNANQWNKSIDSRLLDQHESQYNYNSAKDLIRCIRNTTQHHHQLFKDAQKKTLFFDSQQSAFQYFEQRHPTLIVQLYRRFINTDDAQSDNLKDYFVVSTSS
ncbi:hypothetical protein SAMD00019534_033400 [Acytostelium subglobosum LB1]|uniref:hypothetical protein n=1 Tax=Acytostelium subglobosum LB1 TaxID=1410327 RepID=UPI000644EF38|nr:hypothetical protein SAMD00019534_033400 [Acytostelium subglobosum LB1]GAM20165.1 hypothetical protein SAMD00019534_033400 [Acytostelium subglobosum LB1]|eukprot:XP_012759686.1 hypothetical protein SAMD00019534_033400 [Acytostelium subglobosum LB1]